jgi:ribA/ribD-fused uncharacterized protein
MKYSKRTIQERSQSGEQLKYLFFWGNQETEVGVISKACLSQWYDAPFTHEGVSYYTSEHWMMAEKARLFNEPQTAKAIIQTRKPGKVEALGRQIVGFDQDLWDKHRFEIVVQGNVMKFSQNPRLKEFILSTGCRVLVEASPVDHIWGIGLASHDPKARMLEEWKGENLLGFALMEVRDQLRILLDQAV